jgi:hypothetical protein
MRSVGEWSAAATSLIRVADAPSRAAFDQQQKHSSPRGRHQQNCVWCSCVAWDRSIDRCRDRKQPSKLVEVPRAHMGRPGKVFFFSLFLFCRRRRWECGNCVCDAFDHGKKKSAGLRGCGPGVVWALRKALVGVLYPSCEHKGRPRGSQRERGKNQANTHTSHEPAQTKESDPFNLSPD